MESFWQGNGFTLGLTLQLVPSQCSINVLNEKNDVPVAWSPTAHTSLPAAPATPRNPALRAEVETTLQVVPSKCSARVCVAPARARHAAGRPHVIGGDGGGGGQGRIADERA